MPPALLSAGAVVFRRTTGGHAFLLLRAYRNWGFPKGLVEPGEAPFDAAVREVREETGLADLAFPFGEVHVETPPYSRGKVARFYLAETATERVDLGANPSGVREHHAYRWLDYDAARPLLVERLRSVLDWAQARLGPRPPA
jgi:bis(5'-nucleosidyl)-tetraphosphatase